MAVSLEEVEKLREKSGATYEACRDALEQSGGDLLDALIYLERAGRAKGGSVFTTQPVESAAEAVKRALVLPQKGKGHKGGGKKKEEQFDWAAWFHEVGGMGLNLLRHATVNQLEVWRKGKVTTSIPILILVLLMVVAFWITIPLMIMGLFFGCSYRFVGPDLGKESINNVMNNVSATVDDMVDQVKKEFHDETKK